MPAFFKNLKIQKFVSGVLVFLICLSSAGLFFYPKQAKSQSPAAPVASDTAAVAAATAGVAAVTAASTAGIAAMEAAAIACVGESSAGITATAPGDLIGIAVAINACLAGIEEAQAVMEVRDTSHQIGSLAEKAAKDKSSLLTRIIKLALGIFRKMLLDYMVDEIIKWIQGEGDPSFVTDWGGFIKNAADQAGGFFLQEILSEDVMAGLCRSDWAIKINISLRKPKKFGTRAMCTFKDIEKNFNQFMDNFINGGWAGWIKITEDQNNPYGLYLMALNEKLDREIKAQTAAMNEAQTGFGFLNDKRCIKRTCTDGSGGLNTETGTWKKTEAESTTITDDGLITTCECNQWETRTPGKMMADAMNIPVNKDIQWLISNEEIESYIAAIVDALLNRLIKEGVMAITSADISAEEGSAGSPKPEDYMDSTAPITTASTLDAWRIQIISNEPAIIYYTLDGTEPTVGSLVYIGPITITSPVTLKWFGVDNMGNKEGVHSMSLNPPFTVTDAAPSTAAVAVSSNSISLLAANRPGVTIYHTLDGTAPTLSSPRYVKKIEINIGKIINWFGVNLQGQQETIHTATAVPPFPNSEFPTISDLVNPAANISAPSTVSANQFFRLDPSHSADNDSTPRIAMYEWDFDNDGNYDWWTVDYNRDGAFDESQCRNGAVCVEPSSGILNGFLGMQVPAGALPGAIDVKYQAGFARMITLRVTDDEGLWSTTNVVIDVQ